MKINNIAADYTAEDAAHLVRAFQMLTDRNTREGRAIRSAFVWGLQACGIQCVHIESGKVHALRVFAPDGQDFPTTKKGVETKKD